MASLLAIGSQNLTTPTQNTARPLTLTNMGVNTGLTLNVINKKLQIESTLDDAFEANMTNVVYTGSKVAVPNSIYMKLSTPATGTRSVTIPFLKALKGLPRVGNAQQMSGYERDFGLKYAKFYYNEYSHGVAVQEWGVDANDVAQFNLYAQAQPQISKAFQEITGMWKREALLQNYCTPLTAAPVSLTQGLNSNWFIANLGFGEQPAYDPTLATFTASIVSALGSAATGTNGVNANIDVNYLLNLEVYARDTKRIEPIKVGGQNRYVVFLPSTQIALLRSMDDGQLGKVWIDVSSLSKEEASFPGIVGRVGNLLIIEDQRYPTIVEAGGALTIAYVQPGNEDARNKSVYDSSSNKAWDIGYLCGTNALANWEVKGLHFEEEKMEYGKVKGISAFGEGGWQAVYYNVDTPTAAANTNVGSCVLAMSSASLVKTA